MGAGQETCLCEEQARVEGDRLGRAVQPLVLEVADPHPRALPMRPLLRPSVRARPEAVRVGENAARPRARAHASADACDAAHSISRGRAAAKAAKLKFVWEAHGMGVRERGRRWT